MTSLTDIMAGKAPKGHTPSPGKPKTSRADNPLASSSLFSGAIGDPVPGTDLLLLKPRPPYTIALIYGQSGCGKTCIGTGYPDPDTGLIVGGMPTPYIHIDLDGRAYEQVLAATQAGRTIYYLSALVSDDPQDVLGMENEEAKSYATEMLNRIKTAAKWAAEQARTSRDLCRGIFLDGVNEYGDLIKLAVRGRVDRPLGTKEDKGDFGKSDNIINRELWFLPNLARSVCMNLVMTGRAGKVYKGREATGEWTWACDKAFDQACDWSGEIRLSGMDEELVRQAEEGGGKLTALQILQARGAGPSFELKVDKAGNNIKEKGKVYTGEMWGELGPFAYAARRLMPRSTEGDWQ